MTNEQIYWEEQEYNRAMEIMNKDIIVNNPNVGKNLQDHIGLDYLFSTSHNSLNKSLVVS